MSPLVAAALALHGLNFQPRNTGGWMVGVNPGGGDSNRQLLASLGRPARGPQLGHGPVPSVGRN